VPARGWALQPLSGAVLSGHGHLQSKLSASMAKSPTRRNGQALPGAFGVIPGTLRFATNVCFVRISTVRHLVD